MIATELIADGLSLMLFGMGFVFLFLALLVLATTAMSTIVTRFYPQTVSTSGSDPTGQHSSPACDQEELIAAISGAIQMHRTRTSQSAKGQ